jgi:putative flippase GtrA
MRVQRAWITKLADRYSIGFFAYLGVAGLSALSEWTSFVASLSLVGPIVAAFVGFFFGTLVNFVLSRQFVFRSVRQSGQELLLVVLLSAFAFSANFLVYIVLFLLFGVKILLAKIIGTGFGFTFNYLARQFFIYSRESPFASMSAILRSVARSRLD